MQNVGVSHKPTTQDVEMTDEGHASCPKQINCRIGLQNLATTHTSEADKKRDAVIETAETYAVLKKERGNLFKHYADRDLFRKVKEDVFSNHSLQISEQEF